MDFTLGGEHLFGPLSMDWNASYAQATEERPNERYIDFQLKKQQFDMDLSNEREPLATPKPGSTMTLNKDFGLKNLPNNNKTSKKKIWNSPWTSSFRSKTETNWSLEPK